MVRPDLFFPKRSAALRLILIPLLVSAAWILAVFLFGGMQNIFGENRTTGLIAYTLMDCVIAGTLIPAILVRAALFSGDVNMFQIGFRSPRRTMLTAGTMLVAVIFLITATSGSHAASGAAFRVFIALLPSAISMAMICWVLTGTHVQAFVRSGGSRTSIPLGIAITSLLFGVASIVLLSARGIPGTATTPVICGITAALIFFSIRDVWATCIAIAGILAIVDGVAYNAADHSSINPLAFLCTVITLAGLTGIHLYLARHFRTISAPG
jgi:hypothetical protein